MTGVAVFDLDGTLVESMAVDEVCFVAVAEAALGDRVPADWLDDRDRTDTSLFRRIWRLAGRPDPTWETMRSAEREMASALHRALRDAPQRCRAVAGGAAVIQRLRAAGWLVAVATGSWRASAQLKLAHAGLPEVHLVTASEESARPALIARAVREVLTQSPPRQRRMQSRKVVYVGDGPWDVAAASAAGTGFLGRGRGAGALALREAGARVVVDDFADELLVPRLAAAAMPWRQSDTVLVASRPVSG
jgi:phosphoglycolate phosphatase-like HAD superfamily hydrolase